MKTKTLILVASAALMTSAGHAQIAGPVRETTGSLTSQTRAGLPDRFSTLQDPRMASRLDRLRARQDALRAQEADLTGQPEPVRAAEASAGAMVAAGAAFDLASQGISSQAGGSGAIAVMPLPEPAAANVLGHARTEAENRSARLTTSATRSAETVAARIENPAPATPAVSAVIVGTPQVQAPAVAANLQAPLIVGTSRSGGVYSRDTVIYDSRRGAPDRTLSAPAPRPAPERNAATGTERASAGDPAARNSSPGGPERFTSFGQSDRHWLEIALACLGIALLLAFAQRLGRRRSLA